MTTQPAPSSKRTVPLLPAVLLVRGGSKRLPGKWRLPWLGRPLLTHAVRQMLNCPGIGHVYVGTDSDDVARVLFEEFNKDGSLRERQCSLVMRAQVPDEQSSLQGLRDVAGQVGLWASHLMLCQCTSPYINSADLQLLAEQYWVCANTAQSYARLTTGDGVPSGMGYVFPPEMDDFARSITLPWNVAQSAPGFDIDTAEDYHAAVMALPQYQQYADAMKRDLPGKHAS